MRTDGWGSDADRFSFSTLSNNSVAKFIVSGKILSVRDWVSKSSGGKRSSVCVKPVVFSKGWSVVKGRSDPCRGRIGRRCSIS